MNDLVRLSPSLPEITPDIFTSASAIVGIRGSGKTNDGVLLAEQAIQFGVPIAVIDPTSAWWGLKSSRDGKHPGLPIYIFGGEHGDVPLDADAGSIVARFVVERRVPVILDVSDLSKGKQRRFVGLFLETLYDLKNRQRDPLLVILDEVPRFCPQQSRGADPDLSRCIGAVEDIVSLGRSRGLGCAIIGQRPATINKNILTQADNLFAMRTVGTQDRKAIDEWVVEAQGDQQQRDELVRHIATLPLGEGYFWSPAIFGVFRRVKFAARATFDSSRTPKVGEQRVEATSFAQVDLEALRGEIAKAVEKAKADDPRALRTEIAALQKQLRERPAIEVPKPEIIETPILRPGEADALVSAAETLRSTGEAILMALNRLSAPRPQAILPRTIPVRVESRPQPVRREIPHQDGQPAFRAGAIRMLEACAQFEERGLTRAQIAALAKIKQGPTFSTYFSELRAAGYVIEQSGRVFATPEGIAFLPSVPPKPRKPEEIISRWRGEFRAGAVRMLDIVVGAYPKIATRAEIAEGSGILPGPTFSTYLSELKRAELIDERNGGLYAVVLDLVAA